MDRMIIEDKNGNWGLKNGYPISQVPSELYCCLAKLKDYESTGLSPDQIYQIDLLYTEKCKEVAELRKKVFEYAKRELLRQYVDEYNYFNNNESEIEKHGMDEDAKKNLAGIYETLVKTYKCTDEEINRAIAYC